MSIEFTVDVIEQKKTLLFVAGIALADIKLNDSFTHLYQYGTQKKSKKQVANIELKVESIILDGEPVEMAPANSPAMLALSGDAQAIEEQAQALNWRKKSGRMIRTSELALTLADS